MLGSLIAIENGAQEFSKLLASGNLQSGEGLGDPLRDTVFNLTRIEKNIDPRTKGLLRAYIKVAYFFKERRQKKFLSDGERGQLQALIRDLNNQRDKLKNDKKIQEELLDD